MKKSMQVKVTMKSKEVSSLIFGKAQSFSKFHTNANSDYNDATHLITGFK